MRHPIALVPRWESLRRRPRDRERSGSASRTPRIPRCTTTRRVSGVSAAQSLRPLPLGDPCPPGLPVVSIPRQPAATRLDMPCVAPEVRRRRVHPGRDQRIPDSRTPSTEEALRVGSTAHGMPAPGDGTLPSLSVDRRDSPTVIAPDRHCRVERPRAGPATRCRRPSAPTSTSGIRRSARWR